MVKRIPKLLMAANGAPCMNCGANDNTIVAAHSDQLSDGKGTGIKCPDYYVAYLCGTCHTFMSESIILTKQQRFELWDRAFKKTVEYWFIKGIVKVA